MKRILSVILVLALCFSFAGCKQDKERELYNLNLEKYVELGTYKGIKVDTKSDDFKTVKDMIIDSDIEQNLFYKGTVKDGDVVNIDYVGKKDGVAFEGGSASGYDLEIGSNTFIDGFEEGLIGMDVGEIKTLDLKFPDDYGNEELKGAEVTFTVRVNYTDEKIKKTPKEYYKDLGYATLEEYEENVKDRAIEESLAQAVSTSSKVKDYPKTDLDSLYKYYYDTTEANIKTQYGITMDAYFEAIGKTEEEFKSTVIVSQIKPLMDQQMLWYLIFDKEKMTLTEKETDEKIKQIIANSGNSELTKADVIEQVGAYYIENIIISEKVFDFLEKNATIS